MGDPILWEFCKNLPDNFEDLGTEINKNSSVGIVCDKFMTKHYQQFFPERPERILKPLYALVKTGIINKLLPLNGHQSDQNEILQIHLKDYFFSIKNFDSLSDEEQAKLLKNVFICPFTYECALISCGSTLIIIDNILNKNITCGLALVRPPGHHADVDSAEGFCFFNNVAIAAKHAQKVNKEIKILILDWDVHHGNGTQSIFYEDSSVLYISMHRYEHGKFYPSFKEANFDMIGDGAGKGYNINIAWQDGLMGDAEYLLAFDNVVMPIATEFEPDLVLISAGFDAAEGDPLGGYRVSAFAFGYMTQKLQSFGNGKVAIILEGGYNTNSIANCVIACAEALLGEKTSKYTNKSNKLPNSNAVNCVLNTINSLLLYWSCLDESLAYIDKLNEQLTMSNIEINHLKNEIINTQNF